MPLLVPAVTGIVAPLDSTRLSRSGCHVLLASGDIIRDDTASPMSAVPARQQQYFYRLRSARLALIFTGGRRGEGGRGAMAKIWQIFLIKNTKFLQFISSSPVKRRSCARPCSYLFRICIQYFLSDLRSQPFLVIFHLISCIYSIMHGTPHF